VGSPWRRAWPERAETVEAELRETRELLDGPGAHGLAEAARVYQAGRDQHLTER
jgi:hypothetical protein